MDDDVDKDQPLYKGSINHIETIKYEQVRHWILSSYDGIEEWEKKYDIYLRDYMRVLRCRGSTNLGKPLDYILWLKEQFENSEMSILKRLDDGPSIKAASYKTYRINGFVFYTAVFESCKTSLNSVVKVKEMTNFIASARDQNPREAETIYYGVIKEITELDYYDFPQTVSYCDWVQVEDKVNGSSQVFYCQDPTRTDWSIVIDVPKRLDKDIDVYEEPLVFETGNLFTSSMMGLINENIDDDEEITEGSWIFEMISPSQSTPNLLEPLPIPAGGSHEHSTTSEYVLPEAAKRKLMTSANILWRNGKKIHRKKYDKWDTDEARKKNCPKKTRPENWVRFVDLTSTKEVRASRESNKLNRSKMVTPHTTRRNGVFRVANKMMEVDPTTTRSNSFLVGHTRSDVTFPAALVAKKMIAVKEIIANNPQSKYLDVDHDPLARVFGKVKETYIDLENRLSQYKAENDVKFDSLSDMVRSLRSFERATTPNVNVDRSRVLPVVGFLSFLYAHKGLKMVPILGYVIPYFCGYL
ncbi:hypothetical protein GIB67_032137 [Kingdonia uniflora]|uniref:Uncharacterized protein n=1 Tax=Kingdonia uniflora TaxID=39325 RepID=A0A7J7MWW4_9MAGN|nr:hypothetical protein GIB67_032137 [Kingdonia uniflora]